MGTVVPFQAVSEQTAKPQIRQWNPAPDLNRKQAMAFNEALKSAAWKAGEFVEKTGVKGVSESVGESRYRILGAAPKNELYASGLLKIQETHGHIISASNYQAIVADLTQLCTTLDANPVVVDKTITPEQAKKEADARAENQRRAEAQAKEMEERSKQAVATIEKIAQIAPKWASAMIVAKEVRDESDISSDYFGSSTLREVLIGFRSGSREDLRQYRVAAANFPETAHLGPGCDVYHVQGIGRDGETAYVGEDGSPCRWGDAKQFTKKEEAEEWIAAHSPDPIDWPEGYAPKQDMSVEHRENYSMGGGYYLKAGTRHGNGWKVSAVSMNYKSYCKGGLEIAPHLLKPQQVAHADAADVSRPTQAAVEGKGGQPPGVGVLGVALRRNEQQNGVELRFRDRFDDVVAQRLKNAGFRWSGFNKCYYCKATPAAIAFAEAFVAEDQAPTMNAQAQVNAQDIGVVGNAPAPSQAPVAAYRPRGR